MSNDYIITEDGELYHYGVPGMKWGVRKANRYTRISKGRRRMSDMYKGMTEDAEKEGNKYAARKYRNTAKLYDRSADKYAKRAENLLNKNTPANSSRIKSAAKKGAITLGASAAIAGLLTLGVSAAVDRAASIVTNGAKSVHDAIFDYWW